MWQRATAIFTDITYVLHICHVSQCLLHILHIFDIFVTQLSIKYAIHRKILPFMESFSHNISNNKVVVDKIVCQICQTVNLIIQIHTAIVVVAANACSISLWFLMCACCKCELENFAAAIITKHTKYLSYLCIGAIVIVRLRFYAIMKMLY